MIIGRVDAQLNLLSPVPVRDASGHDVIIEAMLDTGFTSSMTLPAAVIASLGLTLHNRDLLVLADGQIVPVELYQATVVWDGQPRHIFVHSIGPTPLLGRRLLLGYDLRARVEPGGRVEIEEFP